jgi:hypothetical protein
MGPRSNGMTSPFGGPFMVRLPAVVGGARWCTDCLAEGGMVPLGFDGVPWKSLWGGHAPEVICRNPGCAP